MGFTIALPILCSYDPPPTIPTHRNRSRPLRNDPRRHKILHNCIQSLNYKQYQHGGGGRGAGAGDAEDDAGYQRSEDLRLQALFEQQRNEACDGARLGRVDRITSLQPDLERTAL